MTRITGRQARELLIAATPGPWECHLPDRDDWWIRDVPTADKYSGVLGHGGMQDEGDARLAAAAPDLAETVAWLYGREPDGHKLSEDIPAWSISGCPDFMDGDETVWLPTFGGRITVDRIEGNLTPNQAVDLARALLAAAEEARGG